MIELPGADHIPWVGDNVDEVLARIETIVTAKKPTQASGKLLATVLCTEIVGDHASADQIESCGVALRAELKRFRGSEAGGSRGAQVLATFDSPARAVRCAQAILGAIRKCGFQIKIGVHPGEVELIEGQLFGRAAETAIRIASLGEPDDILTSPTLEHLVAGAGIFFEDFGSHRLEGIAGDFPVLRVSSQ